MSRLPQHSSLYAQAETFLQLLDPVVEQLREELPQAGYDRRSLGQLIGHLMQFQDDALGVNVSSNLLHLSLCLSTLCAKASSHEVVVKCRLLKTTALFSR